MAYIPMINPETGEVDPHLVAERAELRAARDWGGPDYPPRYLRIATEWCTARARDERLEWRRKHGLPDDAPMTEYVVPAWGASGDSYGRAR
jgi:hypothetical protein